MDYTVILPDRIHLGNERDDLPGGFFGPQVGKRFDCPGIDATVEAVLMFQSLAVNVPWNVLRINGVTIDDGLPTTGVSSETWTANVLIVSPGTLKPTGNVLHIEARTESGGTSGNLDDFVLSNMVLFYQTSSLPLSQQVMTRGVRVDITPMDG